MQLLAKIPSKHYFVSIFVIGTMLFIAFSMVIYRNYDNAQNLNVLVFHDYEVIRQNRLLLFDLLNMETGVRGYLLTGKKQFLSPYDEGSKGIPRETDSLRNLLRNEKEERIPL